MKLTDDVLRKLVAWYRGNLDDKRFYLNIPKTDWMIYGATDPQKLYLMSESVLAGLMAKGVPFEDVTTSLLRARIEAALRGVDKTQYKEVSNFWLKQIGSIPYDAQKLNKLMRLQDLKRPTSSDERDLKKLNHHLTAIKRDRQDERGQFVVRFLRSPRFSLVRDWDRSLELEKLIGEGNPTLKAPATTESGKGRSLDSVLQDLTIRRMCKFLIYDSIGQGKGIAYLLDDLDLDRVAFMVGANHEVPDVARVGGDQKVPICTSEIREIFRNWDKLKNDIHFYDNFMEVPPPWDPATGSAANLKEWAAYAAHRAQKILVAVKNDSLGAAKQKLEDAIKASGESRHVEAIRLFHEARPSRLDQKRFLNTTIAGREVKTFAPSTS